MELRFSTHLSADASGGPRLLAYIGNDTEYFENLRQRLVLPGDPWLILRLGDGDVLPPHSPISGVFLDVVSLPTSGDAVLDVFRNQDADIPVVLLTGLTPTLEEIAAWAATDSVYRMDWLRLRGLTRWIQARCVQRDQMRRLQGRLDGILGHTTEALLLLRMGEIQEANAACMSLLGLGSMEDPTGRTFLEFIYPEDRPVFQAAAEESWRQRKAGHVEFRVIRHSGSVLLAEAWLLPLSDARGMTQILLHDRLATHQAREELRRSRDTLEAILGSVPHAITVIHRDGKFIYANREAARSLGCESVEDLLRAPPSEISKRFEILDGQGRAFRMDQLPNRRAFLGQDASTPVLMQWRRHGGVAVEWSMVSAMGLKDPDGTVSLVVSTSQNVTPLLHAERELRESEERFRHLAEAALEGIALVRDGKIQEVNNAFGKMLGMPPSFFKDLPPDRFFEPASHAALRQALAGDGEESMECLARTPGGRTIPVQIRGRGGQRQGRAFQVLAMRNLASERKQEEDTAHLFQLSSDLLCLVGKDGYFKRLSRSWEKMLGYSLEELYARPWTDFVFPEDVLASKQQFENRSDGSALPVFENRFRCKDGSVRWIQWKSSVLPGGDPILGIGRNVTEEKQRRLEAEEKQRRDEGRRAAFHQVLTQALRTLFENRHDPKLETLGREVEALLQADSDPSPSAEENFDLSSLLQEALPQARVKVDAKTPRLLRADPRRLRDFFRHVFRLWNFSTGDAESLFEVRPGLRERDCFWVEFRLQTVRESVSPVPPWDPGEIGEICRKLCGAWIGRQGGRWNEAIVPEESLAFSLPFPVGSAAETGIPSEGKTRWRVLLVEDHPINQRLMLEILRQLGPYQVTVAETGQEAIRLHAAEHFDLVLMDCHLPGLSGMDATRRIRAEEAGTGNHVPILALTADAMERTRLQCLEAGMDDFLTKPVLIPELSAALFRVFPPAPPIPQSGATTAKA